MIYFFEREPQIMYCEICRGTEYVLTVILPGGAQLIEHHASSAALEARWDDVINELANEGWRGPFTRDQGDSPPTERLRVTRDRRASTRGSWIGEGLIDRSGTSLRS